MTHPDQRGEAPGPAAVPGDGAGGRPGSARRPGRGPGGPAGAGPALPPPPAPPAVYLDNAATTQVCAEAADAARHAMVVAYANPSSLHRWGLEAERLVARARRAVAAALGCAPEDVVFTSGGTEGNNAAILGVARARRREGSHCITSAVEHRSVLQAFEVLEDEGFEVTRLPVDATGAVSPDAVAAALRPDTILVSLGHVNNEVGTIQPLRDIGRVVARHAAPRGRATLHVDAVQSLAKLAIEPAAWGADLVTVSGHKVHAPKGVGALCVRPGTRLRPLHAGGEQERGLRPGTENVPGIAGFGAALEALRGTWADDAARMMRLKQRLAAAVMDAAPQAVVNGPPPAAGAPHILNVSFPGVRGEVLLHALEAEGVAVSTGSACTSRHPEPSHVLVALGLRGPALEGAIRFSLSRLTTEAEVDAAVAAASRCATQLRRVAGVRR